MACVQLHVRCAPHARPCRLFGTGRQSNEIKEPTHTPVRPSFIIARASTSSPTSSSTSLVHGVEEVTHGPDHEHVRRGRAVQREGHRLLPTCTRQHHVSTAATPRQHRVSTTAREVSAAARLRPSGARPVARPNTSAKRFGDQACGLGPRRCDLDPILHVSDTGN